MTDEPFDPRDGRPQDDERQFELSLRPTCLAEYIGQRQATTNLRIFIKAAQQRREALDHVLLTGPPGLGKTTLANIIANEMKAELRSTAGPVIEKSGDLAALLTNLQELNDPLIEQLEAVQQQFAFLNLITALLGPKRYKNTTKPLSRRT